MPGALSRPALGGETIRPMKARIAPLIARLRESSPNYARAARIAGITLGIVAFCFLLAGPVTLALPQSCNACHADTGEYAQWNESAHARIGCQECHVERGYLFGAGNSASLVTELSRQVLGGHGDGAWVPDSACLSCHPEIGHEETFVVGTLRVSHAGMAEGGYRCVDCHSDTAHELDPSVIEQPTMATCASCHNGERAAKSCETCHPDAAEDGAAQRHDAEWARTHGSNWQSLHGMGELATCVLCHEPSKCESCHGVPLPHDKGFAANHGSLAVDTREACITGCHTTSFCDSCHGIEMPHPAGFLEGHSSIANDIEDEACSRCHTTASCNDCHRRHVHPSGPHPLRFATPGR